MVPVCIGKALRIDQGCQFVHRLLGTGREMAVDARNHDLGRAGGRWRCRTNLPREKASADHRALHHGVIANVLDRQ